MINLINIVSYLIGNFRYELYYNKTILRHLMRGHIREQIKYRINSMDRICFSEGQCKKCGCNTTALQMANKACDKPCYPKMLKSGEWDKAKTSMWYQGKDKVNWYLDTVEKKFVKICYKDGKRKKMV